MSFWSWLGFGGNDSDEELPDYSDLTPAERRERRREDRLKKIEAKRKLRIEKINAIKEKIYAVASKRKWLFFIIAAAIAAYLIIFKGSSGGISEIIKGLF